MSGINPPSYASGQRADEIKLTLLYEARDSIALYLETRGLAGLTIPYKVRYYREIFRETYGLGVHGLQPWGKLALAKKITVLTLAQLWALAKHMPKAAWESIRQSCTKTVTQALRTTPPILAAIIFLFLTSDAWKIGGKEQVAQLIVIVVAVLVISVLFFFIGAEESFGKWTSEIIPDPGKDHVEQLARDTKAGVDVLVYVNVRPGSKPLRKLERLNVTTIYVILIVANFLAVGLCAVLALVFFGILMFSITAQSELMGGDQYVHAIVNTSIAGYPVALTWQLILVSVMLAGIQVLSFAAVGLQDKVARDAFVRPNIDDLKSCVSAFYYYRAVVRMIGAGCYRDERPAEASGPSPFSRSSSSWSRPSN